MSVRSAGSSGSGGGKRESQRGAKRGNFVGKLTQSVRRIVKEVKEDPIDGVQSREEVILLNERLRKVAGHLNTSFCLARQEVVRLETQYWSLVEVPTQDKMEPLPAFVLRACAVLERTKVHKGDGASEEADDEQQDLIDRLDGLTVSQIHAENQQLTGDLYRQLKKYSALRALIKGLADEYNSSKMYPVIPRYMLLTAMIRDVLHHPEYMELYRILPPQSPQTGS